MRECEEDDSKGMVSDIEGVPSLGGKEMLRSIRDGIGVVVGGGVVGGGGNCGVGDGGESSVYRSGGGGVSVVHRSVEVDCVGGVDCLGFHGEGGGGSGSAGGVCCEACCEAGSVVCE